MPPKDPSLVDDNLEILKLLKNIGKFQPIPEKDLKSLLDMSKVRKYKPDEEIIRQDDYDCWIFILLQISFCYTIYRIFAEVLAARLRKTTEKVSGLDGENKWLCRQL